MRVMHGASALLTRASLKARDPRGPNRSGGDKPAARSNHRERLVASFRHALPKPAV